MAQTLTNMRQIFATSWCRHEIFTRPIRRLRTLYISENEISDEGAIALAQALKASFVVSANCSCDRGRGTVGHQPTLCQLHDVFLCHARKVVGVKVFRVCVKALDALYLTEPELEKCEQLSCHVTSVSAASACDGVLPTGRVRQSDRALLPFQTLDTCRRFRRHDWRGIGTKCCITRLSCWASVCFHPDES